ncbi:adenylate kinase [Nigerium sp.]|jgi:adenylate kinase|uniref:adenylate kinase n=1 Tax=Nigerium sp. TaxID=2042655 RepID=UPI0032220C03
MRLLIMGPPGVGKGTQATELADHYEIPAVSSGEIFRENIKNETPLGKQVAALIAAGDFVPDDVTTELILDRLRLPDCSNGWLLDGYPRTAAQAGSLDAAMAAKGTALDAVVSLVAAPDELVGRMLRRAELEGRADDNEETIRHRIDVYHEETEELLDLYRQRGLIVEVDAIGEIADVRQRLTAALDAKLAR